LSKFVSWMNGLNIFQIKTHSRHGMEDFNEDLRTVTRRRCGRRASLFHLDESNILCRGIH
jgi:dynein heavy chain 1